MKARSCTLNIAAIGALSVTAWMSPVSALLWGGHNIVKDGMFTSPKVNPPFTEFCLTPTGYCPKKNTKMGKWKVTQGSVDLVATGGIWAKQPPGASSTAQTVDMNGVGPGSITQKLKTHVGTSYSGSFEFAGNAGSGNTKTMNVLVAGTVVGKATP